jgi:hypothetical protein
VQTGLIGGLVDELVARFTHSCHMDYFLPGVAPTTSRPSSRRGYLTGQARAARVGGFKQATSKRVAGWWVDVLPIRAIPDPLGRGNEGERVDEQ